jgi:hypothetical protein
MTLETIDTILSLLPIDMQQILLAEHTPLKILTKVCHLFELVPCLLEVKQC